MKPVILTLLLVVLMPSVEVQAQRRIDMSFDGQLVSAVEELKEKIKADPDLEGRKLRLGKFSGPNLPDSSFDQKFEQRFADLMAGLLDQESTRIVNGVYDFIPGEMRENQDLRVIQFVIKIMDRQRRTLQTVTREINRSSDIVKITGTTVALPDTADVEDRNKAAFEALAEPEFGILDSHFVTVSGNDNYGVAIFKKTGGAGDLIPVIPERVNGFAFVDLDVNDTFAIALVNHDTRCDASAVVTIDGLDVANTFCRDETKYLGYSVPRSQSGKSGTHLIRGWLTTTKRTRENVFEFVVNELGKGAATEMKSRNRRGVIHVEFYEAVPASEKLPARSFGEVGKGRLLDVNYRVESMRRRESPIANISIRYSNSDRK